ncbi:hypothetical protein ONZ45_g17650 [Pleurotus djamor]|nr:hypothetical protein ONZ45_g17650 [Pleurotus djamor]
MPTQSSRQAPARERCRIAVKGSLFPVECTDKMLTPGASASYKAPHCLHPSASLPIDYLDIANSLEEDTAATPGNPAESHRMIVPPECMDDVSMKTLWSC